MKQADKIALLDWEKFKEDIARATPVDKSMSVQDREKHRLYLERHPVEWIKFFFPNYAKYEFAGFQNAPYSVPSLMTNGSRCCPGAVSLPSRRSPCSLSCTSR